MNDDDFLPASPQQPAEAAGEGERRDDPDDVLVATGEQRNRWANDLRGVGVATTSGAIRKRVDRIADEIGRLPLATLPPPASLAGSTTPGAGEAGRDLMERAAAVLREHHPDQGPEDFAEKVHAIYAPHLAPGAGEVDAIRELLVDHYGDPGDEESQEQAATAAAAVLALVNRVSASPSGAAAPAEDGKLARALDTLWPVLVEALDQCKTDAEELRTVMRAADAHRRALASRVGTPAEGGGDPS